MTSSKLIDQLKIRGKKIWIPFHCLQYEHFHYYFQNNPYINEINCFCPFD
jgi:hypothetical protein